MPTGQAMADHANGLPQWLAIARSYIGTHEGVGKMDNPAVVAMYAAAGHPEVRHDEVPWCAAFVGACLVRSGLPSSGTLWALDYAKYGQKLDAPLVGAIACKRRVGGGGHVFFVAGFDDKYVIGLGGNQNDAVGLARFARSQIVAFRWPPGAPIPETPVAGALGGAARDVRES